MRWKIKVDMRGDSGMWRVDQCGREREDEGGGGGIKKWLKRQKEEEEMKNENEIERDLLELLHSLRLECVQRGQSELVVTKRTTRMEMLVTKKESRMTRWWQREEGETVVK